MVCYYRIYFRINQREQHDIYLASSAQEAVDYCRTDYSPMGKIKIVHVWKDTGSSWATTEAWD